MPAAATSDRQYSSANALWPLMLLASVAASPVLAAQVDSTASMYPCPSLDEIVSKMEQADQLRRDNLDQVSAVRRYTFRNERFGKSAEMLVKAESRKGAPTSFQVLSSDGADGMAGRIFKHILDGETESGVKGQTRISSENYNFEFLGTETLDNRLCYLLKLKPKSRSKYLLDGTLWLDAKDYGFVRIAGRPSASLSFLVGRPAMVMEFAKVGQYWLISRNTSHAQGHLAGVSDLTIEYTGYEVQGCTPGETTVAQRQSEGGGLAYKSLHATKN